MTKTDKPTMRIHVRARTRVCMKQNAHADVHARGILVNNHTDVRVSIVPRVTLLTPPYTLFSFRAPVPNSIIHLLSTTH